MLERREESRNEKNQENALTWLLPFEGFDDTGNYRIACAFSTNGFLLKHRSSEISVENNIGH